MRPSSGSIWARSEEHTSELQSQSNLVCRPLLEKKKNNRNNQTLPPRPWNWRRERGPSRAYAPPPPAIDRDGPLPTFLASCFVSFNDTATTEIYTLSLHDALPILGLRAPGSGGVRQARPRRGGTGAH